MVQPSLGEGRHLSSSQGHGNICFALCLQGQELVRFPLFTLIFAHLLESSLASHARPEMCCESRASLGEESPACDIYH